MASKFEPYGVALLEAKAAGTAMVATRVNEVPEILGEGDRGGDARAAGAAGGTRGDGRAFVDAGGGRRPRGELWGARRPRGAATDTACTP